MRRLLATAALWALVAAAAVGGGVAVTAITGVGGAAVPVLTAEEIEAALADTDTEPAFGPDRPVTSPGPGDFTDPQSLTTEAGTVTVTCSGNVIASEAVTPAAGWQIGPFGGDEHHGEARFTADTADATLVVTYVCEAGKVVWDSRIE